MNSIGQISNFHRMFNKLLAFAIVCGLMILLAGCGGGGDSQVEVETNPNIGVPTIDCKSPLVDCRY